MPLQFAATTAVATESVWVSDTCQERMPSASARLAASPEISSRGACGVAAKDLHVGEAHAADAGAERLHGGLLGGEAGRETRHRVDPPGKKGSLSVGEHSLECLGSPGQEPAETRYVDRVDAHPDHLPAPFTRP